MALTVEDGTGLSTADSYLSQANADTYIANHGNSTDWSGATSDQKDEALRLATQWLDLTYGQRWKGIRSNSDQALDWPRSGVSDRDGRAIDTDELPQKLLDATAEMALRHITETDGIMPDEADAAPVKQEKIKVGEIEESVTYAAPKPQAKRFTIVTRLIADLIELGTELRRA